MQSHARGMCGLIAPFAAGFRASFVGMVWNAFSLCVHVLGAAVTTIRFHTMLTGRCSTVEDTSLQDILAWNPSH